MTQARAALASLALVATALPALATAQLRVEEHRASADQLIDAALRDSAAYRRLAILADRFGHRMSGSESLERAIDWIVAEMKKDGLENVRTEPVSVTHWVRGAESAVLQSPRRTQLRILGLGRSVGTPPNGIVAPVVVVRSFAELAARATEARGKIVLFNAPFDTTVDPFTAYGQAVQYRAYGVDSAAARRAVAVLVRSVTPRSLRTPHTGALSYTDTTRRVPRIPAAAVTIEDAEMLQRMQDRGERIVIRLTMGARTLPPARSRNVIAEVRGSERPGEVVVIGGHIDSWDVGQGAVDDAGGSVAAWEALRLIKQLGVRPKRTIRVVLWTNEEIGLGGALAYRAAHAAELDNHVLAMESDNGVFRPRGLFFSGGEDGLPIARDIATLLKRVGVDTVQASGPEADVWPLLERGVPTMAIDTDPSRYFWYHHTDADMVDKLDPRDMAMCVAVMAVVANTVANMDGRVSNQIASSADTTRTKASLMAADTALARVAARKGATALLDAASPDAAILIPGHPILRADAARDALVRRYGPPASYEWRPLHAVASVDGRFGCTMGFATYRSAPNDTVGRRRGVYATCWERTSAGAWRIAAHQRNEPANAPDTGATWTPATLPHSATVGFRGDARSGTQNADADFARVAFATAGPRPAFAQFIADDGILFSPPNFPVGPRGVELAFEGFPATQVLTWDPMRAFGKGGGGLAYTVGHSVRRARDGAADDESRSKYLTVWRQRADGRWEYILDFGSPRP